jgi:hypothetical protein
MISFPDIPDYAARASHIYWEPVSGSGERITAAVALAEPTGNIRVVSLLSADILSVLYRGQGSNAASLIGVMTDSLKSHLSKTASLQDWVSPVSGFFAKPLQEYAGHSAEDVLDQVAGLHSSLYKARAPSKPERLPSQGDGQIRKQVKDAARRIYGLQADRVFTPNGIIEVVDAGRKHYLDIPIKTADKVGSIMSAWFNTPTTIETHFLRAQSNLAVASERGKYQTGLFISMPNGLEGHKNQQQVEDLIDDIYWRLKRTDCFLEVRETPDALAQEIVAWAA